MCIRDSPWTQGKKMAETRAAPEEGRARFEEEKKGVSVAKKTSITTPVNQPKNRRQNSHFESNVRMQSPKNFYSPIGSPNRGRSPKLMPDAPKLTAVPKFTQSQPAVGTMFGKKMKVNR
eukprot:TRINITY_DN13403_c0_g2_i2.p1 TRINITY_DN13403_c0_g2~~TRINITY_DN13403_c0_g2_i2.p1  ORF type:complete len:139 (-),score=32.19 TRINITY_DN13403_c0_g2_i2:136-492(-)